MIYIFFYIKICLILNDQFLSQNLHKYVLLTYHKCLRNNMK
jgi:hypothetical protein